MSSVEPLEVVRAVYDAFEVWDHASIRDLLAPDVQWHQAPSAVPAAGRVLATADAVLQSVARPLEEDWDGFTEQLEHLMPAGDRVVVTGTYHGTYRANGRRLAAPFCHLWTVADGQVAVFRQFTDTAAFVEVTRTESQPR